jgi:GntR family transcriptional repressor for pyruvate dehydrogenase complex
MVSIPRAAELVARDVRSRIVAGTLVPGERLGSALDMQGHFGVSGPTLREALRILEAESLVEITRGRNGGVHVRRPDEEHVLRGLSMLLQSRSVTLADVHHARAIIEPSAIHELTMSKGRRTSVRRLREIVETERACAEDAVRFGVVSAAFHQALVVESGNQTLALLCEILQELLADAAQTGAALAKASTLKIRLSSVASHLEVIGLIEAGRALDAEAFWREHLRAVGRFVIASQAKGRVVGATA